MFPKMRKCVVFFMLLCVLMLMCSCKQNPSDSELRARLTGYFSDCGFECGFAALEEEREVPIYQSSAWQKLLLDGEEVLLYFDESNRADYLTQGIDRSQYSFAGHFGLRFVLVYEGENAQVLKALEEMPAV